VESRISVVYSLSSGFFTERYIVTRTSTLYAGCFWFQYWPAVWIYLLSFYLSISLFMLTYLHIYLPIWKVKAVP